MDWLLAVVRQGNARQTRLVQGWRTKETKWILVASGCLRQFSVASPFQDRHYSQSRLLVHPKFQSLWDTRTSSSNWKRGSHSKCTRIRVVHLIHPHSERGGYERRDMRTNSRCTSTHCMWNTTFCFCFMYSNPCTVSCKCVSRRSAPVVVFVERNFGRISPEATGTTWRIRSGSDGWSGRVLTTVKQIKEAGGHCRRIWVFSDVRCRGLICL